jgi:uncharacterized protein (DUF488 family)
MRQVRRIVTIGVYGLTAEAFIRRLDEAAVRQLIDIRQRRGVRGGEYAWANARRLQQRLAEAGIAYAHRPELAPTTELRRLQYRADDSRGVGQRSRVSLAPEFVRRYTREILDAAPLESVVAELPDDGCGALFCVEATAGACHRSLVADRMAERFGFQVVHLADGP